MGDTPPKPTRAKRPSETASKTAPSGDRIAKVIARHGLCSRRQAEEWIGAGRVSVNGKTIESPALNVSETDKIEVDGNPLQERHGTRLWAYHKPAGRVVTENDPEGRPTIFQELSTLGLPRVLTVGRLDINTEGLLLLTNDGGLKRVLELPSTGWLRRYRVRAHGRTTQAQLNKLKNGITIDGIKYGSIDAQLEREQGANVWINVALREGKNREIKIVFESMDLQVNRLIRISYGPFQLGDLAVSQVETIKSKMLKDQLGDRLAKEAGVDFDAPMPDPMPVKRAPRRAPPPTRGRRSGPTEQQEPAKVEPKRGPKPRNQPGARRGKRRGDRTDFDERMKAERAVNSRKVLFDDGTSTDFQLAPKKKKRGDDDNKSGPRGRDKGDRRDSGPNRGRRS